MTDGGIYEPASPTPSMGYHVIDPDDLEPEPDRPSTMRHVGDAAGLETLGLRVYDVAPGEEIPLRGLHYHDEQEEAFYVVDGELSVETPERVYHVEAGQCFVVTPGHAHRAYNDADADADLRVLGLGAPSTTDAHDYEG